MNNRKCWVIDIETLKSCWTISGINIDTEEIKQLVIHKLRDQREEIYQWLKDTKGHITFNGINFDYPNIHYFLINYEKEFKYISVELLIEKLFQEAQRIINEQDKSKFGVSIPNKEVLIHQLDLFKLWHYNNKARSTSLKALEISMNYPNVMECDIDWKKEDISESEIKEILEYNLNDVLATYEFYKRSKEKIDLRKDLIKLYDLPMINWNDVKIGESIFLKLLSDDMNISQWDLKTLRTKRDSIKFSDIILNYIKFENNKLSKLLDEFKNITISQTKNGFKKSLLLHNQIFEYGQGGIHQCCKSGVYTSDENYTILDIDVKSFYPNIAVNNSFRPEHLGESFNKIYGDIYKQRSVIPKSDPRNGAFKLMLNGCFGKAGDEHSFLFDNKFLLSITVNGQLLISLLIDKLLKIPDIFFVQSNTDGISIRVPNKYLGDVFPICNEWEKLTGLELEYVKYDKMIIRDVNNYSSITDTGKIKYKGAFEIDKEYHKDNSFRIIPIAISNYFFKNIPIEQTIYNHDNIYDFCGRQKFKKDSYGKIHYIKDGIPVEEEQQKNTRYYISNSGATFVKYYDKGDSEAINKGYLVTIFNKYEEKPIKEYNIDYSFYIQECYKIINSIEKTQLTLF